MFLLKVWYHLSSLLQHAFLKCIYRNSFQVGKKSTWRNGFNVAIEQEGRILIGADCFFNRNCSLNAIEKIEIGDGTILGEGVKIYDHNHKFRDPILPIKKQGYSSKAIHVGKHCWIGSNVILLKGTYIEDNCVIGAGCVISSRIPEGTIVQMKESFIYQNII